MSPPAPWQVHTYERLDELRRRWTDAERPPPEVMPLSSGEYAALALACGYERALASPVVAFVLLDGWLQCWVMQRRVWLTWWVAASAFDLRLRFDFDGHLIGSPAFRGVCLFTLQRRRQWSSASANSRQD